MPGLVFIVGGARSGKSSLALRLAGEAPAPRAYVATANVTDAEMAARVERHRSERGPGWETFEGEEDAAALVRGLKGYGSVLVDCLTLWVSGLMEKGLSDGEIIERAVELARALASHDRAFAVANEVGLGIVPANELARRFRDVAGLVNQRFSEAAEEVYLTAAGLPLRLK